MGSLQVPAGDRRISLAGLIRLLCVTRFVASALSKHTTKRYLPYLVFFTQT